MNPMEAENIQSRKETDAANLKNLRLRQKPLLFASMLAGFVYILWRMIFTIPTDYGIFALIFGLLLFISEAVAMAEVQLHYWQFLKEKKLELPDIPEDWYPHIDILIATHNEEPALLQKTASACRYLNYPDKRKVHIYICDDKDRPEMAAMAEKVGVGYFGLSGNKHAKAGNLNNALSKTTSPIVITLDADMIPRSNFLLHTVPYFFLPKLKKDSRGRWVPRAESEVNPNEKIGFIQTPQCFYNSDLFQYNLYSEYRIPNEQDYFFREINVSRNTFNAPIYAGSNTVLSREALEAVGGIAINTITEDFETGLKIQSKGYLTYAVSEQLSSGMAPVSLKSLLNQRKRWGRGCVQSLRNVRLLFNSAIPTKLKISYSATFLYWWTFFRRLIYILSPILYTLLHVQIVDADFWQIILFWSPAYLLQMKSTAVISSGIRTQHWSNVIDTILFPYLVWPILLETLGIRQKRFIVTNKARSKTSKEDSALYALPHIVLLGASVISIFLCVYNMILSGTYYRAIILYWLVVNSKNLLFAILFMFKRENFRSTERFLVDLPVYVEYGGKTITGSTVDVTENGIAFILSRPEYLPYDESFPVYIMDQGYQSRMKAKVIHVSQRDNGWKYIVQITEIDDANALEYYQIIYDREHSHPKYTEEEVDIYSDFILNIKQRTKKFQQSVRRLPRIAANCPFRTADGYSGMLKDFNYHYAGILFDPGHEAPSELRLEVGEGVVLDLQKDAASQGNGSLLYSVTNWPDIVSNDHAARLIDSWAGVNRPTHEQAQENVSEPALLSR